VIAHVQTEEGVVAVDLGDETVIGVDAYATLEPSPQFPVSLPRVLSTAASGSTVVCLVDAKPPLLVSHDAGRTWRESGRGLPAGRAVAIAEDNPDLVIYATEDRLYLSRDGGRFWRRLTVELQGIEAVELSSA
jgi:photosystem II stability/assembly factor-like uncharacterized protein